MYFIYLFFKCIYENLTCRGIWLYIVYTIANIFSVRCYYCCLELLPVLAGTRQDLNKSILIQSYLLVRLMFQLKWERSYQHKSNKGKPPTLGRLTNGVAQSVSCKHSAPVQWKAFMQCEAVWLTLPTPLSFLCLHCICRFILFFFSVSKAVHILPQRWFFFTSILLIERSFNWHVSLLCRLRLPCIKAYGGHVVWSCASVAFCVCVIV